MDHCQLCYSSLIDLFPGRMQTIWNGLPIQEIISKCSKYISKDLIDPNTNWNQSICEECQENTKQLVQLDLKLEQVNVEIKELIERITTKILNERQNYQTLFAQDHTSSAVPQIDVHLLNEQEQFDDSRDNLDVPCNNVYESLQGGILSTPVDKVDVVLPEKLNTPKKRRKTGKSPRKGNKKSNENVFEGSSEKVTSSDLQLQLKSDSGGIACPKCNKKFTRLNSLKRHDCGSTTFECKTCGKSFFSQNSLQIHNRFHSENKPHKCETCGKSFTMSHHLKLHLMIHSGEKPYQCDICKKSFREKGYLAIHKRQHSSDENERKKFKCDICSKSFTLRKSLKYHLLIIHSGESKYKCKICGKVSGTSTHLRQHELTHSVEKPFKCSFCWKSYSHENTLKMHEVIHTGRKDFRCDECGESFHTSAALLYHHKKLKHADEGEFICDVCGKLYNNKAKLVHHRRHHDKPVKIRPRNMRFTCGVCDRSYSRKPDLIKHQKVVHVVTTISSIACDKCGKEFDSNGDYYNHIAVYAGKKDSRYKCEICNELFRDRCAMICHFNEKHTESQFPFKCGCGRAFLSRKELGHHKRNECTLKRTTNKVGKQVSKKTRSKVEEDDFSEANDTDTDVDVNVNSVSNTDLSSSNVRRSGRVRNKNTKKYSEEASENSSDGERDESLENIQKSESEDEQLVEIKTESDIWIKEEPSDFSDSS